MLFRSVQLLFGSIRYSYCLGLSGTAIVWVYQVQLLFGAISYSYCLGISGTAIVWVYQVQLLFGSIRYSYCLGLSGIAIVWVYELVHNYIVCIGLWNRYSAYNHTDHCMLYIVYI